VYHARAVRRTEERTLRALFAAVRAVGCMPLGRAAARVPRRVCSPAAHSAERRAKQSGPVRPMRVGARIGPQRLGGAALAEPSLVEPRAPY
jgi:hypothetical protein